MRAGGSSLASVALAGLGLLCTAACAGEQADVSISGYSVQGERGITAELDWCGNGATLSAQGTPTSVTLVAHPGESVDGDCAASATVALDSPLGSREVLDAVTGQPVERLP